MIQTLVKGLTINTGQILLLRQKHKTWKGNGWYAVFLNSSINFQLGSDFTFASDDPFFPYFLLKAYGYFIIRKIQIDNFSSVG